MTDQLRESTFIKKGETARQAGARARAALKQHAADQGLELADVQTKTIRRQGTPAHVTVVATVRAPDAPEPEVVDVPVPDVNWPPVDA